MNRLKAIISNENVIAAAKTLGKAVLYAALSAFGVSWIAGCSIFGSGVGVSVVP